MTGARQDQLRLLWAAAAVAGLLSSTRMLVAGAYQSLWDLLWYGDPWPGVAGIILFLAALSSGRVPGPPALLAFALAGAATDRMDLLYLTGGLAAGSLLWHLSSASGLGLLLGFTLDLAARVAAGGAGAWEHPLVAPAYGAALAAGGLAGLAVRVGVEVPRAGHVALASLAELGAAYPNAVLRLSGYTSYGIEHVALVSLLLVAGVIGGLRVPRLAPYMLALSWLLLALRVGGPLWGFAAAWGLSALLLGGPALGLGGRVAGGLGFVLVMVAAVGVYAYPYLGLWPLADRLELVILIPVAVGVLALRGIHPPVNARLLAPSLWAATLILAAALAAPILAPSGPTGDRVLTVISYNIHQGYTWDGRLNPWEVVDTLAGLGGDIVCLQEVDGGRLTSAYIDMPLLLQLAGYRVAYQPAIEGAYGVAIASTGEYTLAQGYHLTSTGEQRVAIKAQTHNYTIINAHLGLDPQERAIQAKELLDHALGEPTAHILCGDLNEEQGQAIQTISKHYNITKTQPTCCNGEPQKTTIDYIAPHKNQGPKITEYKVPHSDASDHNPVTAQIQP